MYLVMARAERMLRRSSAKTAVAPTRSNKPLLTRSQQRKLWYPIVASNLAGDAPVRRIPAWLSREVSRFGSDRWLSLWGRNYGFVEFTAPVEALVSPVDTVPADVMSEAVVSDDEPMFPFTTGLYVTEDQSS